MLKCNMRLFVKTLQGKTYSIETNLDNTVLEFKNHIFEQHGIPIEQQRIIIAGKVLEDNLKLRDYQPEKMATIHLIIKQ